MILLDVWLTNPLMVGSTIAIFIILDVTLTRLGFRLRNQGHHKHFVIAIYEMNPLHQEAIHKGKPIKPIYWILWVLLVILSSYLATGSQYLEIEIAIGALFFGYLGVSVNHARNIYTYNYIKQHPNELKGQISINPKHSYKAQRNNKLLYGIFWFLMYVLIGRGFFLGGALICFAQIILSFVWEERTLKKLEQEAPSQ